MTVSLMRRIDCTADGPKGFYWGGDKGLAVGTVTIELAGVGVLQASFLDYPQRNGSNHLGSCSCAL